MNRVLDIGAGDDPVPGADTLDRVEEFDPDIQHDLTDLPLTIDDNQYSRVYLNDVLEHLPTDAEYLDSLFSELERILKPGGTVHIRVPHYTAPVAAGDLQHSRNGYSASEIHLDYIDTDLEISSRRITFSKRKKLPWNYFIEPAANLSPWFWEHLPFTDCFPAKNVEIVLEVTD